MVIEEDGKTEEEFVEQLVRMNEELEILSNEATALSMTISHNVPVGSGFYPESSTDERGHIV